MSDYDLWPVQTILPEPVAFAAVQEMRVQAEEDQNYTLRCIFGEKVYFVEHTHALAPGHCYSEAGVREATRISGCCEFHFDSMFADDE